MITFSQLESSKWGRLGNQLFQIAGTMGIAQQNQQTAVFPTWSYNQYLATPLPSGKLQYAKVYEHKGIHYKPINLPLGDWDLQGFFTSEKFFVEIAIDVRQQFTPAPEILVYLEQKYGKLLNQLPCSIHVRRGDYIKLRWDFPNQPLAYYWHAISKFPKNTKFLVFSDDIDWCKQQFVGANFNFVENEKDIIDLFLMSKCKNHIIANSTFSWWGAWLNPNIDKVVLCPANWFGPGVTAFPKRYTRDLYAHGFYSLILPGEQQWQNKFYYMLAHPFYKLWSAIYNVAIDIYSIEKVKFIYKKYRHWLRRYY